jgi:hypothetical protein
VDRYVAELERPQVIDLTGGQPDLVPEWTLWMMSALEARGIAGSTYLWSDDNLSNDYYFRFLNEADRARIAAYPKYGRVGCFKGFTPESFAFNTRADPSLFVRQFELMGRLLAEGLEMYAYVTLTTPILRGLKDDMAEFVDRLQSLDENLPLRMVPLQIREFTPVSERMTEVRREAMQNQERAIEAWNNEIVARFAVEVRERNIADVPVASRATRR